MFGQIHVVIPWIFSGFEGFSHTAFAPAHRHANPHRTYYIMDQTLLRPSQALCDLIDIEI